MEMTTTDRERIWRVKLTIEDMFGNVVKTRAEGKVKCPFCDGIVNWYTLGDGRTCGYCETPGCIAWIE